MKKSTSIVLSSLIITFCFSLGLGQSSRSEEPAKGKGLDALKAEALRQFGHQSIKTSGKIGVLRFEEIDRHIARLTQWLADQEKVSSAADQSGQNTAALSFGELFSPVQPDCFFPLTNSVVRLAPEESLQGLTVFDSTGVPLGVFIGKYTYQHQGERSYTLQLFQYQTPDGKFRQSGRNLFLDRFLVRWPDLQNRTFICLGN